jgi:hypothetical protein
MDGRVFRIASVIIVAAAAALFVCTRNPQADGIDSSQSLVCQVANSFQCWSGRDCKLFNPESVGLPLRFIIDFKAKQVQPSADSMVRRRSVIRRQQDLENKIVIQGAEDPVEGVKDGIAWSATISRDNGDFVIAAAGENVGYVVYGACAASVNP